ncbi:MAG: Multifunctional-autoprocessing repeats-in-toxin, partial [Chlamydiae bacterium]|nr:Multifunctional-autoprocessing repeats-in-toxin [Chlamydiota bacterium]
MDQGSYAMVKFILYAALYAVIIYFGLLAFLYTFQNSLIYFPNRSITTPQKAGVPEMKVIELTTSDGLKINAWYSPPRESSKPIIVYFHGNAGNIANRGFIARSFINKGYGMLLLTYRGYSGNPGRPGEQGLYNDARAALRFIKNEGVPPQCLVFYGTSIGGAVAIQMATEFQVAAIILQSPFSSIVDVAKYHYFFLLPFTGLIKDKYDSLSKVNMIEAPVLIIHGKSDRIIPPKLSRKLLEEFPEPKEAEYIPGKGHNDLFEP